MTIGKNNKFAICLKNSVLSVIISDWSLGEIQYNAVVSVKEKKIKQ